MQPNNALHLTPPPPVPQHHREAVQAVSQVSLAVRPLGGSLVLRGRKMVSYRLEETAVITASLSDITHLSVAERIQLAEDIWDTVLADPEQVSLPEAQTQELDQRLISYRQSPQAGESWQEVQKRVRGQR